jgi:capsular polysaccharide biosynthesis protein
VARTPLTILKPIKFEDLATTSTVVDRVRLQLHLTEASQELVRSISVAVGQSALYRVSVTDPEPDRAVAIANVVSQEAAKMYTDIVPGSPATTASQLDAERLSYQQRYVSAAQTLLDYEALHPDVLIGSVGTDALPPDLQGQFSAQAGSPLQPLPPELATTDVGVQARFLSLQLAARLAADSYHNFEAETAKIWVAEVNAAHDFGAQVVDAATTAEPDTATRRHRLIYAAVLAFMLGTGIVFIREYVQRAARNRRAPSEAIGAPSGAPTAASG